MKTDIDGYNNIFLSNFNTLRNRLQLLFSGNPNLKKIKFYGVENGGKRGILVCGCDPSDIRDFEKFYSVSDINFYHNNLIKRLER